MRTGITATKIHWVKILGNVDFSRTCGRGDKNSENYFSSALLENVDKVKKLGNAHTFAAYAQKFVRRAWSPGSTTGLPQDAPEDFFRDQTSWRTAQCERNQTRRGPQIFVWIEEHGRSDITTSRSHGARLDSRCLFRQVLREIPHLRNLLITLGSGRMSEDEQKVAAISRPTIIEQHFIVYRLQVGP